MADEKDKKDEELDEKAKDALIKKFREENKARKEAKKLQKEVLDMTKEEFEIHQKKASAEASGLTITMQLAAANGDILAAVEARKKVEAKIKKLQDEMHDRAINVAKDYPKWNELAETKKTLMEDMKKLKGDDLEAAKNQNKELEEQQKLFIENLQEQDSSLQTSRDMLQALNSQTKALEEQLGAFSNLSPEATMVAKEVKGIGIAVGELAFGLVDYSTTGIGKFQLLAATIAKAEGGFAGLKAGLLSAFSATNLAATAFTKVTDSMMMMLMSLDKSSTEFAKATGSGEMYQSTLEDIVQENISMGVGFENASKGLKGLLENQIGFVDMSKSTQKALAAQAGMLERIGVNAETSADLMNTFSKTMGLGAEDSMALTKNLAMMGDVVGISSGKMIKDFQEANKTLAVYGKQGIKHFTNLAAAAKAAGVEMGTLLGIAGKFDTFEDAADTVGKLNALLGANMSSTEMLMMTEDKRVETLIQQMQVNGESFAQMDRFKQKALANAVGITDMAEANKIFGMSMSQYRNYSSQMDQNQLSQQKWEEAIKATVPIQEKLQAMLAKWAPKMTEWLDAITWGLDMILSGLDWLYEKSNGTFPYIVMAVGALVVAFNGLVAVQRAALGIEAVASVWREKGLKAAFKKWVALKGNTVAQLEETAAKKTDEIVTKQKSAADQIDSAVTDNNTRSNVTNNSTRSTGIIVTLRAWAAKIKDTAASAAGTVWTWASAVAQGAWNTAKALGNKVMKSGLVMWGLEKIAKFKNWVMTWLGIKAEAVQNTLRKTDTIPTNVAVTQTNTAMGTSMWATAAAILAVGVAFLALGAGIYLAAIGLAELVLAFKGMGDAALAATVAIGILMVPFVALMVVLGVALYTGVLPGAAAAILAIGAAALMMGIGVGLAAYGMSFMVTAMKGAGVDGLIMAVALGIISYTLITLVGALVGAIPALIAFAGSAAAAGASAWVLAIPILAIGAAIALAAWGMGEMFKGAGTLVGAFKGMGSEAYYAAFSIAALSYSFAGFAAIISLMAIPGMWAVFAAGILLVAVAMGAMVLAFNLLNTDNLNAIAQGMASLSELAGNMTGMTMGVTFVGTMAKDLEDLGQVVNPEVQSTLDSLVSLSANQTNETITNSSAETKAESQFQITQNLKNELDIIVKIGDTTFAKEVKRVVRDVIKWDEDDMQSTAKTIVIAGDE